MFTNSSEFSSTNYSLEKSGYYYNDVENYLKAMQDNIEDNCEKADTKIREFKGKINHLRNHTAEIDSFKRETTMEIDKYERRLLNNIKNKRKDNFSTLEEFNLRNNHLKKTHDLKYQELRTIFENKRDNTINLNQLSEKLTFNTIHFLDRKDYGSFSNKYEGDFKTNFENTITKIDTNYTKAIEDPESSRKKFNYLLKNLESKELSTSIPKIKTNEPEEKISTTSLLDIKPKLKKYKEKLNKIRSSLGEYLLQCTKIPEKTSINNEQGSEHYNFVQLENLWGLVNQEISVDNQIDENLNKLNSRITEIEKINPDEKKHHHPLENFVRICINNMGESDDDSIGFTSPTTSPMNQILIYGNSVKHTNKKFEFNGDTIQEDPFDEDERVSPDI